MNTDKHGSEATQNKAELKRVFVSSQSVDNKPASVLIAGLRNAGLEVEHSPSTPQDREDERWADWYHQGLARTLSMCSAFVIVIDSGWDSSTWMAMEAREAIEKTSATPRIQSFFWNPEGLHVTARGMLQYLKNELPPDVSEAIKRLRAVMAARR
jgi:hypothetical protein